MEQTLGDAEICIAVLDGPVDLTHPCFNKAKITQLETLVSGVPDNGPSTQHGTFVASLIFGQLDSPVRGVSPGCRGLLIPVFEDGPDDSLAPCSQIDLAHAITQAVEQGAHVINISGGQLVSGGEPHWTLEKAVRLCAENNVLIVAAVGNDGCECLHVPAAISSTLAVGAMDSKGLPLDFSNWGETYQNNGILALGQKLKGAAPGGGVTTKCGTSFATPIVSGIVALLLSIQKQMGDKPDPHAVREAILQSAHPCIPSEGLDCSRHLRGRLNIGGSYDLITQKQQAMTDNNNSASNDSVQQIQRSENVELVESSEQLPTLGVQNAEFTPLNPEIAAFSNQNSALDSLRALENADSIEPKSIDKEENKETKDQIQEEDNITEIKDETCGCPNRQKTEEMNEFNDQIDEMTVPSIHASDVQAAESTITNQKVATQSVMPSQTPPTRAVGGGLDLVYAIGTIGIDFGSEARRDSFIQQLDVEVGQPCPDDPAQLLPFLNDNPEYAEALIWTLEMDGTPVYAIRPEGAFASIAYKRLREFLKSQRTEGVERVSIPGVIVGKIRLFSGQMVPVIMPEVRGMYSWSIRALIKAAKEAYKKSKSKEEPSGKPCYESEPIRKDLTDEDIDITIEGFMRKIYYELRNLGRAPQERAINFAGTDLFRSISVLREQALRCMMLDRIETERSPICRPDSDCWDVKMTFFNPRERLTQAKEVFRLTIDVSDVIPVTVGKYAYWPVWE